MTEADWLTGERVRAMGSLLNAQPSTAGTVAGRLRWDDRRRRLARAALYRLGVSYLVGDAATPAAPTAAVTAAEDACFLPPSRFAAGIARADALFAGSSRRGFLDVARTHAPGRFGPGLRLFYASVGHHAAACCSVTSRRFVVPTPTIGRPHGLKGRIADALRDVFGNPFRGDVLLERDASRPGWLGGLVADFAHACVLHHERGVLDAVRLSVLADAMEEAGAGDDEDGRRRMAHFRSGGVHYRGCHGVWAILSACGTFSSSSSARKKPQAAS